MKSQKTPHPSPLQAKYGVYFSDFFGGKTREISRGHCISADIDVVPSDVTAGIILDAIENDLENTTAPSIEVENGNSATIPLEEWPIPALQVKRSSIPGNLKSRALIQYRGIVVAI